MATTCPTLARVQRILADVREIEALVLIAGVARGPEVLAADEDVRETLADLSRLVAEARAEVRAALAAGAPVGAP